MSSTLRDRLGAAMAAAVDRIRGRSSERFWEGKAMCQPRTLTPRNATRPPVHFEVLHEIFETQADLRPESVAVVFGREQTTYAELEQRANQLAHYLRWQGVGRGSLVAMLLPRGVDACVTLLGILKAGAACVPINPAYPVERVAGILDHSDAHALVTTTALSESCADDVVFSGAVVRMDTDRVAIGKQTCERLPRGVVGVGPPDLCHVIYTSDSAGGSKGVLIEHRNACKRLCAEGEVFRIEPEDRVYQGFSLALDASVEEAWLAFHAGAALVAATPEMAHAGPGLSRMFTDAGVTVLSCRPTLLSMLNEDVPTVRLLILGGEACPDELLERWSRPGRRMVNTYGPTESSVLN